MYNFLTQVTRVNQRSQLRKSQFGQIRSNRFIYLQIFPVKWDPWEHGYVYRRSFEPINLAEAIFGMLCLLRSRQRQHFGH